MVKSKGWEWENANQTPWLKPTDNVYYLANKWSELGFKRILDLGSGLGRHSIFFAQHGFDVSAIDISDYGVSYLEKWAEKEKLDIDIKIGDMISLPYEDNYFDCVFAYHSISHADTEGMKKVVGEIERVLKQGGELYTSMGSKESWMFTKSGFPKIDENTILNKEDGPENNVPHFYANREDILTIFNNFDIEEIRHIDYCYINHKKVDSKHYYISARKKGTSEQDNFIHKS
ncbi:class I SAM-dependent methyltransferase [Clostridium hydrogenum]|uniref:class I SAM-dependent methyltransferase n=1 Tax=Clostridium hydrogenum TaxID=2855764 RepID=UPI001F19B6C3|nr:class I SAM-dependent methyltransferase [Clostridium hydrogenum]